MTESDSQSPSPSPKSDDEFRSPRKTIPLRESNKNKNTFFSTPNRYSPLETSITNQNEIINNATKTTTLNNSNNLEPDTHMDTEATQSTTNVDNTIPKIPPLFVINITQFTEFRQKISETILNGFTATARSNKIKINVETIDDFRALTKFLDFKKYEYYTHRLKDEKEISAIIRNLPLSITETEIKKELIELNFPVKSVTRLTNKDKTPTPLIAVQLYNSPISPDIFKLDKLFNCIIITEQRRKSKDPPQCTNCQRYGHIHKSCKLNPRCVKCNGPHHYTQCIKKTEEPPTCVNCNEPHPANYKGCKYFKNIMNQKSTNAQKYTRTESQPLKNVIKQNTINHPPETSNITSYADIAKGKSTSSHTYANLTCNGLSNDHLQKTIQDFIENILLNIQTIIISIFNSITNQISVNQSNVINNINNVNN